MAKAAERASPVAGDDEIARLRRGLRGLLATLRTQWDQLQRLDHFRREGVSNLSHDLRSPLTATTACLETLDGRWAADPARGDDRALLQVALRNTRDTTRLVRSLGDLALLDEPAYRLDTTRLDVGEVLDDLALRFAERAARQGVELRCPHDPTAPTPAAEVDIELFERALANLVDNALKHTPAGGCVTLSAERVAGAGPEDAAEVQVRVADTGCGIPADALPHLFDRFFQRRQGVAPAGSDGGKGLGLAIVERIAELHGGRLSVQSRRAGAYDGGTAGTTVTLHLPTA
jgi:signal transduction histidine kinase